MIEFRLPCKILHTQWISDKNKVKKRVINKFHDYQWRHQPFHISRNKHFSFWDFCWEMFLFQATVLSLMTERERKGGGVESPSSAGGSRFVPALRFTLLIKFPENLHNTSPNMVVVTFPRLLSDSNATWFTARSMAATCVLPYKARRLLASMFGDG